MVRRVLPSRVRRVARSIESYARYGPGYPRAMEPIEVTTAAIRTAIANPLEVVAPENFAQAQRSYRKAVASRGRVVGDATFADFVQVPVGRLVKYRFCVAHWRHGVPWERTGVYEHMLCKIARSGHPESGCATIDDLRTRYARLDRIFERVRREGRLRAAHELDEPVASGGVWNGIEVHLGPDAEPIFGDAGTHRLAMAHVLGLKRVPAMLGFVHEAGLSRLAHLRRNLASWVTALSGWSWVLATV